MKSLLTRKGTVVVLFSGFICLVVLGVLILPLATGANPPIPPTPAYITRLPPVKQTMEMETWGYRATAAAGTPGPIIQPPPPSPAILTGPTPTKVIVDPHRQAGVGILIPNSAGTTAGAGALYFTTDKWIATINGKQIVVEAGAINQDVVGILPKPWQGIVFVRSDDDPNFGGFFLTPVKAGTTHIVDANGTQLKIVAEDGTTFTFDVSTLKFVSP